MRRQVVLSMASLKRSQGTNLPSCADRRESALGQTRLSAHMPRLSAMGLEADERRIGPRGLRSAVTHSPAEITAAWPTTVTSSRWPRALMRRTQKPLSALWKVTRSTRPARTSRSDDRASCFMLFDTSKDHSCPAVAQTNWLGQHHQPIGCNAVNTCFLDMSIPGVKRRVRDERGSICPVSQIGRDRKRCNSPGSVGQGCL